MYGDLKLAFVQRCLDDYMRRVVEAMRREIVKRNVIDTGELLKSLSYAVYQKAVGDGSAGLSFAEWGRMIDMGVGRGHPLGGLKATREALGEDSKGRKPRKFYSPIAYGKLNGLMGDLLYGYTEETKAIIKKELDAANSQATV